MQPDLLTVRDLYYRYQDGTNALNGLNISVPVNCRAAILGANGAGKSTLFLHFNGLLRPLAGSVYYRGREVQYNKKALMNLRQRVGIVFQNPDHQLFSASVWQDISFGLMNQGCGKAEARMRVEAVGEQLGISELFFRPTHFLSVGQKKMVSLAGVLAMEPELIICDEPTAGLDPENAQLFMYVLNQLQQQGKTIVISTHDVNLAYQWADLVWLLHRGQVLAEGSPLEVFDQDELLKQAHLETPWLLEIWRVMEAQGLVSADMPPRSKAQLRQALHE